MCLVSPTVFSDCMAEHEWGRISTGTGKANDQKPEAACQERGGRDSGKERHFQLHTRSAQNPLLVNV